jgi:hypothetical protein
LDWIDVVNAIFRSGPDPIPAVANVDVHWTGTGERTVVRSDNPPAPYRPFGGQYERAAGTVQWSAEVAPSAGHPNGYVFDTAFATATTITSAYTAKVRTGVFYP